ncbi:MAG TPA: DUF4112 domain-containing protein, partial [Gemmatimonadales bacterium]|nr:DUF4112 domain-containing protein [Gemmatimonadales bacterium]
VGWRGLVEQRVKRLQRLAELWDSAFRLPGTRVRVGLDPIVGLIPGIGDAAGALVSAYIVLEAARFDVPGPTLLRMLANVAIDALLGSVPVIGDIFDVGWQANIKNVALIERHLADPHGAHRSGRAWLLLVIAVLVLLATAGIAAGWLVIRALTAAL